MNRQEHLGWMSDRELFNHSGTLPAERIEELLELTADREPMTTAHIEEALTQFPAEDFLSDVERRLNALHKRLRGNNREELGAILELIGDIAQTTFNAADYGRSELRKQIEQIDAWNGEDE